LSHKVTEDLSYLTSKTIYYILYSCINMFDFKNIIKYICTVCAHACSRARVGGGCGWKRKCL